MAWVWTEAARWILEAYNGSGRKWPAELPPEKSPDFSMAVLRHEMKHRTELSRKIKRIISGELDIALSDIEAWLYRQRLEWGADLIHARAQALDQSEKSLQAALRWALVQAWENEGCINLWKIA